MIDSHIVLKPKNTVAVFLGPSLTQKQARQILHADYYPPACKGDIYRIMAFGVETIVLIDGLFHNTPSVWQRELVDALEEGIQVLGASSMGALRAAELHNFGMIGYGKVFEWYRDGVIDGDDEVALLHGLPEAEFRPLSEPLVNIRYTLLKAVEDYCITNKQAEQLSEYAKQTYYPERSYRQLLNSSVLKDWAQKDLIKLEHYFRTKRINLKRLDAIGVLRYCASLEGRRKPKSCFNFFSSTSTIWQRERLLFSGFMSSQGIIPGEKVLQEAEKDASLISVMHKTLSKQHFLMDWARQNGICYGEDNLDAYIERWEEEHSIDKDENWLRANGLTPINYKILLEERALLDWVIKQGPNYFGLDWNFQQALQEELQLIESTQTNSKEQTSYRIKPLGILGCEEDVEQAQGDPALVVLYSENNATSDAKLDAQNLCSTELADMWLELSQRRFLLEWARQNGVSYPPDCLNCYTEQWEEAHDIANHADSLQANGLNFKSDKAFLAERALVEWITQQGPNYFGCVWNFKVALLRELQITGKAVQLVEKSYA